MIHDFNCVLLYCCSFTPSKYAVPNDSLQNTIRKNKRKFETHPFGITLKRMNLKRVEILCIRHKAVRWKKKYSHFHFSCSVFALQLANAMFLQENKNTHTFDGFIYSWMTYSFVSVLWLSYNLQQTNWKCQFTFDNDGEKNIQRHIFTLAHIVISYCLWIFTNVRANIYTYACCHCYCSCCCCCLCDVYHSK